MVPAGTTYLSDYMNSYGFLADIFITLGDVTQESCGCRGSCGPRPWAVPAAWAGASACPSPSSEPSLPPGSSSSWMQTAPVRRCWHPSRWLRPAGLVAWEEIGGVVHSFFHHTPHCKCMHTHTRARTHARTRAQLNKKNLRSSSRTAEQRVTEILGIPTWESQTARKSLLRESQRSASGTADWSFRQGGGAGNVCELCGLSSPQYPDPLLPHAHQFHYVSLT